MKMTAHTDYALRMLIHLAVFRGRPCTVNDVAETFGLSRNHLLKVAYNLRKMGLLHASRGRSGGISLATPAGDINIGSVIRGMEEDFSVVECLQRDGGTCLISPACRLKAIAAEALEAYLRVFDSYTLADLVRNEAALAALLADGKSSPGASALPDWPDKRF
jgi:Rrf2 family transcriptional regulator, nitric oxide-sensitive transcriptional repressor